MLRGACALKFACLLLAGSTLAAGPVFTDREHVDDDFAVQGEYAGSVSIDGAEFPIGVQVIAAPWREDLCLRVAAHLERLGIAAAPAVLPE